MSRGARRAMWASIVMLFAGMTLISSYEAYHWLVMPRPVELGDWSDADALVLPTPPMPATDEGPAKAAPPRLYASLQPDVLAVQRAESVVDDPSPADVEAPQAEPTGLDQVPGQVELRPSEAPQAEPTVQDQAPGQVELPPADPQPAELAADPAQPTAPTDAPPSFEAALALARRLVAQGELGQALPQFERALELRAHSVDALLGKASALLFLQDYDAAKSSAQQAIAIDPRSGEGMLLIGKSFERLGDRDGAKRMYERCADEAVDGSRCRERISELDAK